MYVEVKKFAGLSNEDFCARVSAALKGAFPSPSECYGPYVEALFDDKVVFSSDRKLWQVAYTMDPTAFAVTFSGVPVEVIRSYTPIGEAAGAGAAVGETPAASPAAMAMASAPPPAAPAAKEDAGSVAVDQTQKSAEAITKSALSIAGMLRTQKAPVAPPPPPAEVSWENDLSVGAVAKANAAKAAQRAPAR